MESEGDVERLLLQDIEDFPVRHDLKRACRSRILPITNWLSVVFGTSTAASVRRVFSPVLLREVPDRVIFAWVPAREKCRALKSILLFDRRRQVVL